MTKKKKYILVFFRTEGRVAPLKLWFTDKPRKKAGKP